jgi:hypothetical protein
MLYYIAKRLEGHSHVLTLVELDHARLESHPIIHALLTYFLLFVPELICTQCQSPRCKIFGNA